MAAQEAPPEGPSPPCKRLFIFGLGYTGEGLGRQLLQKGWHVAGTCRTSDKLRALEILGISPYLFDPHHANGRLSAVGLEALLSATHVLITVPPTTTAPSHDLVLAHHSHALAEAAERHLRWIGYLSSTGVYGDWNGDWVDESTPPRPTSPWAVARLQAEQAWQDLGRQIGIPAHVFRLGGIYGPGRSVLDAVQQNLGPSRAGPRHRRRFTARIHVADACSVLEASMTRPAAGSGLYNVVDDNPAARHVAMEFAGQLSNFMQAITKGTTQQPALSSRVDDPNSSVQGGGGSLPICARVDKRIEIAGEESDRVDVRDQGGQECIRRIEESVERFQDGGQWGGKHVDRVAHGDKEHAAANEGGVQGGSSPTGGLVVAEKRVRNRRLKTELGVILRHADFTSGLLAIASGDQTPFI